MKEKLSALLEVRKIIALVIVFVFVFLAVTGKLNSDKAFEIILMVITYYFAKSTALDMPKSK